MRDVSSISEPKSVVGVRINIEVEDTSGGILDDFQHKAHSTTINKLSENNMKVILLAHQSNAESSEVMREHTQTLEESTQVGDIRYEPDKKITEIAGSMEPGEVVMYENLSEINGAMTEHESPEEAGEADFTQQLCTGLDAFVNDSFSLAHKNYPSTTGIPTQVPSYAGRFFSAEYNVLQNIIERGDPLFVFGGQRVESKIESISKILDAGFDSKILTGGLVGSVFLTARGYELGNDTKDDISAVASREVIEQASQLNTEYGDKIVTPDDIVTGDSEREEFTVSATPIQNSVRDIGTGTIKDYCERIDSAHTVVAVGPLGVVEKEPFQEGTERVYRCVADSDFSVVGGYTAMKACDELGITGFKHTSNGHEAFCQYLANPRGLPGINVLLPEDSKIPT